MNKNAEEKKKTDKLKSIGFLKSALIEFRTFVHQLRICQYPEQVHIFC